MSHQIDHPGGEKSMSEQLKREFSGLDAFIPVAPPFEQIEGAARMVEADPERRNLTRRPVATPRFRAGAGASLALIGIALAMVVALGSGAVGPRRSLGGGASPTPATASPALSPALSAAPVASSGCSIPPSRTAPCASAGESAAASSAAERAPKRLFAETGSAAFWSPDRTRVAIVGDTSKPPVHIKIVDLNGQTLDTIQVSRFGWVDDDTYLGVDDAGGFVGHVGSSTRQALAGVGPSTGYGIGGFISGGGVVALGDDNGAPYYRLWTVAGGMGERRPGSPIDISPDGRYLAVHPDTPDDPLRLDIVRTDTGALVSSYTKTSGPRMTGVIGFSPDGSKFAIDSDIYAEAGGPVVILDLSSGSTTVFATCTAGASWLDGSHLAVGDANACKAPAGSSVTVVTVDSGVVTSSKGSVASVDANPADPQEIMTVTIRDASGREEAIDLDGSFAGASLSWSADGSVLLVQYQGLETVTPPEYFVMLRP